MGRRARFTGDGGPGVKPADLLGPAEGEPSACGADASTEPCSITTPPGAFHTARPPSSSSPRRHERDLLRWPATVAVAIRLRRCRGPSAAPNHSRQTHARRCCVHLFDHAAAEAAPHLSPRAASCAGRAKPEATMATRMRSPRLSSNAAPRMMLASGSTSCRTRLAASSTSQSVMLGPPMIDSSSPFAPSSDMSSSSGLQIASSAAKSRGGHPRPRPCPSWRCPCPS